MQFQNILLEENKGIATLSINRPKVLNALNKSTIIELSQALDQLKDNDNIRVIVLTGSGTKAFVAGADISEFASFDSMQGAELAQQGQALLFDKIANYGKPIIAAVNGFALGGGLELAMAAHIRVASDNAKMGLPEVSLGVIPGYGGTQRLAQLVGKGKAMEMIITAGMMDAQEALKYNLVNYVVPQEELIALAEKIAGKIMRNSPQAIGAAIQAVNANYNSDLNGFNTEIELFGACFETEDFKEGTTAFLEKRKANF
jgi:enoyl-CoA hydratase